MIVKRVKAYFEKGKERKRISKQYALEKACVDYFNNCVPHVDDLTKLVDNIPIGWEGLPLLVKSDNNSYPLQAVKGLHGASLIGSLNHQKIKSNNLIR